MITYPLIRHIIGENPTRRVVWTVTAPPGPGRAEEDRGFMPVRWEPAGVVLRTEAEAKH